MHTFKDNADRTWSLNISVFAVKRCRALLNVNIYGLVTDGFAGMDDLLADPCKLVDVLFVLCMDEAKTAGVSDEDFGRGLAGDALQRASDAFVDELIDFFPDPRARAGLRKVMETSAKLKAHLLEKVMERASALDLDSLATKLSKSSGAWPESSE